MTEQVQAYDNGDYTGSASLRQRASLRHIRRRVHWGKKCPVRQFANVVDCILLLEESEVNVNAAVSGEVNVNAAVSAPAQRRGTHSRGGVDRPL